MYMHVLSCCHCSKLQTKSSTLFEVCPVGNTVYIFVCIGNVCRCSDLRMYVCRIILSTYVCWYSVTLIHTYVPVKNIFSVELVSLYSYFVTRYAPTVLSEISRITWKPTVCVFIFTNVCRLLVLRARPNQNSRIKFRESEPIRKIREN